MTTTSTALDFAAALFAAAGGDAGTNFVCSPWSVATALSALAHGTDAAAREEIVAAVGPVNALRDTARLVAEATQSADSVLAVANRLWVDEHAMPDPRFASSLAAWPGAAVLQAPIGRDPEAARVAINGDVASTTRDLIPEILAPGMLQGARAVLVNALYLLAGWLHPFNPEATAPEPFRSPGGDREVPMMRARLEAPYARSPGGEYVSLHLGLGLGLAAEVLLPPPGPLTVTGAAIAAARKAATAHHVQLRLPRVRVEGRAGLEGPLADLGVRRIFDPGASAVTGVVDEPLYVSDAVHQAVLHMDEVGIEAAAATAMLMLRAAHRPLPAVEMLVDRPFWLLVTHRATGSVLFMARVVDP